MRGWRWVAVMVVGFGVALALAQDPLKTLPKNYWMEFENSRVKVIHAHYPAMQTLPVHDHPDASVLYIYLNDAGPLKFLHDAPHEFPVERKPVQTGQIRMAAAKAETHRVQSLSSQDSDSVRVEFQTVHFSADMHDVREPAADEAFWSVDAPPQKVVFEDARLRVTRLGVLPGQAKELVAKGKAALWIAVRVEGASYAGKVAHAGECWDTPGLSVKAGGSRVELVRVEWK